MSKVASVHELDSRLAHLQNDIGKKLANFPSLASFKKTLMTYDEKISICKHEMVQVGKRMENL
jgi:hypothetical protein